MRLILVTTAVWLLSCALGLLDRPLMAQDDTPRIWQGVYSEAQAERGKATFTTACTRCHGGDLAGTTAPSLKGDRFMSTWGGEHVGRLFEKVRDTMPPNFGTVLDDTAKLDIVTYILRVNGYPAGSRELTTDGNELAGIQILRQGEQAKVQNFALIQTVGCLTLGTGSAWMLTRTADPTAAREDVPTPEALAAAAAKPLGAQTFFLHSVTPFNPESFQGQKMEARGLVYIEPGDARITLTSLKPVGTSCGS